MATIKNTKIQINNIVNSGDISGSKDFSFSFSEEIGLSVPSIIINFRVDFISIVSDNIYLDKPFEVNFKGVKTKWKICHYSMPDENHLTVTGVPDYIDKFIHQNNQSYIDGSSIDAIKSVNSLSVVIDEISDDKQIWIQDNISDKDYLKDILLHSNIVDDHLLYYIDFEGNLKIKSYNKLVLKNTYTYGEDTSDLGFNQFIIESIPISFRLKVLNNQYINNQNISIDTYNGDATGNSSNTGSIGIDCGNVGVNYYKSFNSNNSRYLSMMSKIYSLQTKNRVLVKPLDTFKVTTYHDNTSLGTTPLFINKTFVITKVNTSYSDGSLVQRLWFCKI